MNTELQSKLNGYEEDNKALKRHTEELMSQISSLKDKNESEQSYLVGKNDQIKRKLKCLTDQRQKLDAVVTEMKERYVLCFYEIQYHY